MLKHKNKVKIIAIRRRLTIHVPCRYFIAKIPKRYAKSRMILAKNVTDAEQVQHTFAFALALASTHACISMDW